MTSETAQIKLKETPESLSPGKFGISGSVLKLIAVISMLIDHTAGHFLAHYAFANKVLMEIMGHKITLMVILRKFIGRLAFPLYAYCIAAGCVYTHDIGRYFSRVVVLALISQPIYVAPFVAAPMLLIMLIVLIVTTRKGRKERKRELSGK